MYHIEVTCDARPVRVETAKSVIDAVATVSHYVVRGTLAERQEQQAYLSRELPRSIRRTGSVSFEVGAVVVTITQSH